MAIEVNILKQPKIEVKIKTLSSGGGGSAEDYQNGYNAGYMAGESVGLETGKQAEYDRFWNVFQQNGNRTNYNRAFFSETTAQSGWNDDNYNPKYPIVTTRAVQMFWCNLFTDTKVPITLKNGCDAQLIFGSCTNLNKVQKIILEGTVTWVNAFLACDSLTEIEFEGMIDNNIDFSPCAKLAYASLINIIEHLKDFTGTSTTRTLTLGAANLAKLTDAEKAVATQKGWTLA